MSARLGKKGTSVTALTATAPDATPPLARLWTKVTVWDSADEPFVRLWMTMRNTETFPRLHFQVPFDERTAWEAAAKGWFGAAEVETEDGARYTVTFYDPVRLWQDLEAVAEQGRAYLAEPGMIVVPEVTEAAMREAVRQLAAQGWFRHFRPIGSPP